MIKTILVHVDHSSQSADRTDIAARLAMEFDAHLIGTAATGLSAFAFPVGGFDAGFPPIVFPFDELRADADRALDRFEQAARKAGVNSFERRRMDDEPGYAVSMQARYADVVVLSQPDPNAPLPRVRSDFTEYVLLNCVRPVLVVPHQGLAGPIASRLTVAWNGSTDAVRAITSALPMLRRAQEVSLIVLNADEAANMHGDDPGADIALYLARHRVKVDVTAMETRADIGEALLSFAADKHCDMLVMGAYGHSRFREILLGGATRSVLATSRIALWMAH